MNKELGNPDDAKNWVTSIVPWLSITNPKKAVEFYKKAFCAVEVFRLDGPDHSVVSKLSVDGAEFWLSDAEDGADRLHQHTAGPGAVRMILSVRDPDEVFQRAFLCGAKEIFPVSEGHGWRIGKVEDPFGHIWEIGKPL